MNILSFGTASATAVLIQPVDAHDLSVMEGELATLRERTDAPFRLLAVQVERWNRELSPWNAPAVFGNEAFGDGAKETLERILPLCADKEKTYYLGGYSLAGLFALWAAYETDVFAGVAAASPSLWFPGFADFMRARSIRAAAVSLSLGDKEEKTRNPVMATVGDRVREVYALLQAQGVPCRLELNPGNHFREPDKRTAKAFSWLLERGPQKQEEERKQ